MSAVKGRHEIELLGVPASPGIAIAPALLLTKDPHKIEARKLKDSEIPAEIERFKKALEKTRVSIEKTRSKAVTQTGDIVARIFDSHLLILEDVMLLEETLERLEKDKISVEAIIDEFMQRMYRSLKAQKGEYFSQRADDVLDVSRRLIANLQGLKDERLVDLKRQVILVAAELSPSDVVQLDPHYVVGIATDLGGETSHTAILTRSLGVPAVTGLRNITELVCTGQEIVINGNSGKAVLFPTEARLKAYRDKRKRFRSFMTRLKKLRELPTETTDGRRIHLMANIELPAETETVLDQGGEGIGLFRTEYLFLTRGSLLSEEDQLKEYRRVAEIMAPNPVIVRTFDLGGDKVMPGLEFPKEQNPFLGWRAIRVSLDLPDLLKAQLSAILQASTPGNVRIMLPLISDLDELRQAKKILEEVKEELRNKKIPFDEAIKVGIMIEVPSAALTADALAQECDFFSIGTNDLVQYTLAVDRGNETVAHLYTGYHPAVLQLLNNTVEAAHKAGIPVACCGELAGDPLATLLLVGLGLDELSVSPVVLPEIKKIIRSIHSDTAREVAQKALTFNTPREVKRYLLRTMKKLFADLPVWFTRD
ncbi:MAG: phosphoenolpyruvate--protein phosphotransferase [bacterium]